MGGLLGPGECSGGLAFLQWQDMSRCRRVDVPNRSKKMESFRDAVMLDSGERQRAIRCGIKDVELGEEAALRT